MYNIWVLDSLGRIIHDLTNDFEYVDFNSLHDFVKTKTGANFDSKDLFSIQNNIVNAIFSNKYYDINHDEFTVAVKTK